MRKNSPDQKIYSVWKYNSVICSVKHNAQNSNKIQIILKKDITKRGNKLV